MDKAELLRLAERVEALSGHDALTNRMIAEAFGLGPDETWERPLSTPGVVNMNEDCWIKGSIMRRAKNYTGSLDAAMTLVPEGWEFSLDNWSGSETFGPCVCDMGDDMRPEFNSEAKTLALALCAAALRALAKEDS